MRYGQFPYYLSPRQLSMCDCETGDVPAEEGSDALGFEKGFVGLCQQNAGQHGRLWIQTRCPPTCLLEVHLRRL